MLRYDNYFIPKTLKEYFELTSKVKDCRIVAGCTDMLPWAREGRGGDVFFKNVVDVSRIKELNVFKFGSKKILLGAATNYQKLFLDKKIRKSLKVLPQVSVWFADDQIRELATIGGNIVNASPAGDGMPAFLTLNTKVTVASFKNKKIIKLKMPLEKFVKGRNKVALNKNDLLVDFEVENTDGYGACFEKVGHRRSLVISTVCVSSLVKLNKNKFQDVRVAVGGVCEVPTRLTKTENFLKGKSIDENNIYVASKLDLDVIQSRSRREYRREVLQNFIIRSILKSLGKTNINETIQKFDNKIELKMEDAHV
ncbi:aerobic-type carbon monoxide dehydrogenase, middle subunit CoxM/CutM-like protein [alpha proteobacterium HIMB114]|nr:aerobic-type carbon monoxide dehydrogenase, middle subunit CoxM/CutM-like protein [alpha proteobacterium HIMB114]